MKAASICGSTHSSNRFLSSSSNTSKTASVVPFSYNHQGFDFIPFHPQVQGKRKRAGVSTKETGRGIAMIPPRGPQTTPAYCRQVGMTGKGAGTWLAGPAGIKTWGPRSPMAEHVQRWREFVISFQACATAVGRRDVREGDNKWLEEKMKSRWTTTMTE